jgi:hypothetical protein
MFSSRQTSAGALHERRNNSNNKFGFLLQFFS